MEQSTFLESDKRNGNLHITLAGAFDEERAKEVSYHICSEYCGQGNVFINTHNITEVKPQSRTVFTDLVEELKLPKNHIYFKGEKGRDICHDEGKVIVVKHRKHGGCGGRCKNCKCKDKKVH